MGAKHIELAGSASYSCRTAHAQVAAFQQPCASGGKSRGSSGRKKPVERLLGTPSLTLELCLLVLHVSRLGQQCALCASNASMGSCQNLNSLVLDAACGGGSGRKEPPEQSPWQPPRQPRQPRPGQWPRAGTQEGAPRAQHTWGPRARRRAGACAGAGVWVRGRVWRARGSIGRAVGSLRRGKRCHGVGRARPGRRRQVAGAAVPRGALLAAHTGAVPFLSAQGCMCYGYALLRHAIECAVPWCGQRLTFWMSCATSVFICAICQGMSTHFTGAFVQHAQAV